MPKRKSEDRYEKIFKKIKKLEKKLRRRRRSRSSSSSESLDIQEQEHVSCNESNRSAEKDVTELLDGATASGQDISMTLDTEVAEFATDTEPMATTSATITPAEQTMTTSNANPLTNITCEETDSADVILDSAILEILGEDPTVSNTYGSEIHKNLAVRLEHVATHGVSKELRKELTEKYLLPNNCKLINAPELNAEIKAAVSDMNIKRDRNIEIRQKQMATAISSLAKIINKLILQKNADPELTKTLMDTGRILCDLQYNDSVVRRHFILSSLKKDMKDQLQNTKPDSLLFGQNLIETIKTAKAINRSGVDLKTTPPSKQQTENKKPSTATATTKYLNWKGPFGTRKQMTHPKTKGLHPNSRPSRSSKHSRQQQTHSLR